MTTILHNNKFNDNNSLDPNYISGFIDAEGCFHISILRNNNLKLGISVRAIFQISLHRKDQALIEKIRNFYGIGRVVIRSDNAVVYEVHSIKDMQILLNHLEIYPLITDKWIDLQLFKQVVKLIVNKEHLTMKGLTEIVNIKASMNFGSIPEAVVSLFPAIKPIERPVKPDFTVYHPYWMVGYVEGEGMFFVNIYKKKEAVLGKGVKLIFKITQDKKNLALLESFTNIFTVGKIYQQSPTTKVLDFMITGFTDIIKYVIPFFQIHPLEGAKQEDFNDFVKVSKLMESKAHLSQEGLEKIHSIKSRMNSNRY